MPTPWEEILRVHGLASRVPCRAGCAGRRTCAAQPTEARVQALRAQRWAGSGLPATYLPGVRNDDDGRPPEARMHDTRNVQEGALMLLGCRVDDVVDHLLRAPTYMAPCGAGGACSTSKLSRRGALLPLLGGCEDNDDDDDGANSNLLQLTRPAPAAVTAIHASDPCKRGMQAVQACGPHVCTKHLNHAPVGSMHICCVI